MIFTVPVKERKETRMDYIGTWNILNHIFNVDLKYYSPSHNYQTRLKQSVNLNINQKPMKNLVGKWLMMLVFAFVLRLIYI